MHFPKVIVGEKQSNICNLLLQYVTFCFTIPYEKFFPQIIFNLKFKNKI